MFSEEHSRKTQVCWVLVDGVGDVAVPEIGHLTPLQHAAVPTMDALAAAGLNGLLDPVEPGQACGSDTAHMSLFGYEPRRHYRGRGAFESVGAGLDMKPGDIAFKCNFATMDDKTGIVTSRRADRNFEGMGPTLCGALDGLQLPGFPEHRLSVKYATEHRCGLVVSGPLLTDRIKGTDPLKDNLPLCLSQPMEDTPEARNTAALVNKLSEAMRTALSAHPVNRDRMAAGKPPANVLLMRGCATCIDVPSFHERHGWHACIVSPTKIICGLGASLGMDVVHAPGGTGDYFTKLESKARTMAGALEGGAYDLGFLHVKAVDDAGHDRNLALKVAFLERVDQMLAQLVRRLWEAERAGRGRYALCLTGDHSTPYAFGDHSVEPVPLAVARLAHVVEALGGEGRVLATPLVPIANPAVDVTMETAAAAAAAQKEEDEVEVGTRARGGGSSGGQRAGSWGGAVAGDDVCAFSEVAAARGSLGRFPGSELMRLIQDVTRTTTTTTT